MKIGLLFAGQGAQYPGMGKSLYENSKEAQRIFDLAGDEIKNFCFEGTKEALRQTEITQPCIYTVTMAAYEAFLEAISNLEESELNHVDLQGMAGFSLGEYAALTAGGTINDFNVGLDIVKQRGKWMSEASKNEDGESKGGMIAAFGERQHILDCVEQARDTGILEGVNFNSPIQTVIAGDREALERFKIKAKELGQIKAVPLSVSTAFHCPMMEPAVGKLQDLLSKTALNKPSVKIYSNVTGRDMMEGSQGDQGQWIAELMARQAKRPVYWQETIENMHADGVEVFIELGPGKTLSGLVKKINPELGVINIQDIESLEESIGKLKTWIHRESGMEEGVEEC